MPSVHPTKMRISDESIIVKIESHSLAVPVAMSLKIVINRDEDKALDESYY